MRLLQPLRLLQLLRILAAAPFAALVACAPGPRVASAPAPASNNAPAPARSRPSDDALTILHFNDVYEITPVAGGHAGGLARVATLRKQLHDSGAAVLTTLGGDFISPSALGTARVDGERLAGRQMVAVLNAVGVDWVTLGNHEFDVSESSFRARLAESRFRYVIANVTDSSGRPFPGTVPHAVVKIRSGAREWRVGLIGVVLSSTPAPWVRYSDPIAAAATHAAMLRDSVDLIVALTHLSINDDQKLVEQVPDIDLVLGGHEHENYLLQRGEHFTPIIKGDANVRTVAVVTVRSLGAPHHVDIRSRLVPITDAIPDDSAVAAEVRSWVARGFAGYRELGFDPESVVTVLKAPLDGREAVVRTRSGSLSDVIIASMRREAPDAEVAIFNGGSIRIDDVIPPGPITQYDIIRILPFGGKLIQADIEGALLQRVIDQGRVNAGSGGFLHLAGVEESNGTLSVAGAPLDRARRYRVVTTDYLLSGAEVGLPYLNRQSASVRVIRELRDVRMALIAELRAQPR